MVVEQDPILKRLAIQFGATHVLDPGDIDVSEAVRLLTDDMGADVVFQISDQCDYEHTPAITSSTALLKTIKARNAAQSAISACRTRGTIVNIAPREIYEHRKTKYRNELERGDVQFEGLSLA